jgi:hypothetical protein
MTGIIRLVVIAVFVGGVAVAQAQDAQATNAQTANTVKAPEGPGPKATLADMRWLVGHWKGTGLGGVSEEMWSEPAGGAMMGMYRLITKDAATRDAVTFYEFLTLVEEEGSLALKLKHFNPDLTGWEEKDTFVTFRLAKLTPNEAWFGGLTFRRVAADRLEVFLALRGRDGGVREETFLMDRVK